MLKLFFLMMVGKSSIILCCQFLNFIRYNDLNDDLDGKLDMVVIGVGTGGTITGVAKRLREYNSKIKIICYSPIALLVIKLIIFNFS